MRVPSNTFYYYFIFICLFLVLDAKLTTGERQPVISTESHDGILVFSSPLQIKRLQPDKSILQLNITKQNFPLMIDDSFLNINLSVSNLPGKSNSNAYGVSIMIYFNSKFLQLKSLAFANTSRFSLPPSRNKTRPGFIMIQTDTLWLLNRQEFSIIFRAKYPQAISRGETCNGNIIIDFAYKNNLAKFNGATNSTLQKMVHFKCKIDQSKDVQVKSMRLPSPAFSMVYDEVNQQFFFCYQKKTFMTRTSTVGFHNKIKALLGINSLHFSSNSSEWSSVKDQPQMRVSVCPYLYYLNQLLIHIFSKWMENQISRQHLKENFGEKSIFLGKGSFFGRNIKDIHADMLCIFIV